MKKRPRLITTQAAAKILGIHPANVRRLHHKGELVGVPKIINGTGKKPPLLFDRREVCTYWLSKLERRRVRDAQLAASAARAARFVGTTSRHAIATGSICD